jgi:hypothetical protein
MLMTCKALIHYIGTYKRITHKRRRSRVAKSENNARGSKQHQQSTSKHCEEADSNVRYTTRRTNIIRMGVGFSEGQSLLPFYADSGRKATFTILCQFQAGRFYHFISSQAQFCLGALHAPLEPSPKAVPPPTRSPPTPTLLKAFRCCSAARGGGPRSSLELLHRHGLDCFSQGGVLLHESEWRITAGAAHGR